MAKEKLTKEYYIGLDMGTSSVGWAVTDEQYEVIKRNGKALWGIRLFDEAQTAEGRRLLRIARRRVERRKRRIALLQELFAQEIYKVDPGFFMRLKESRLYEEDKSVSQTNSLFNDPDFDDKAYHKKYPTIYHLRSDLMKSDRSFDVRLVYLALHHMIKNRGHFLYTDFEVGANGISGFEDCFAKFAAAMKEVTEIEILTEKQQSIKALLSDRKQSRKDKAKELQALLAIGDKEQKNQIKAAANLLCGLEGKMDELFADEELKDVEYNKISFSSATYEDRDAQLKSGLSEERYALIAACKELYDWSRLVELLGDSRFLSDAKIAVYEKHKKDLKVLKTVLKQDTAAYNEIFKSTGKASYAAYVKHATTGKKEKLPIEKSVSAEDFYKEIKKKLEKLPDSADKNYILQEMDLGTFLPKAVTSDNGVIPYQLHKIEMIKILEKAKAYLPFLNVRDDYGTVADKMVQILEFRVPYYVGPTNPHAKGLGKAWAVRQKDGRILPWNFSEMVNEEESAEGFIRRMTGKCTYLLGEDVLPKNSLLYAKYTVLNELNNVRIGSGELKLDAAKPGLKMRVYENLFMTTKNVSKGKLAKYLKEKEGIAKEEAEQISGLDEKFNASLAPWIDMNRILGDGFDVQIGERILLDVNLFGGAPNLLKKRLKSAFPNLTEEQIKKIGKLPSGSWGRLSKKFLTEILPADGNPCDTETGEVMNIITALEKTDCNLMQLLSSDYGYTKTIEKENEDLLGGEKLTYETLEDMYISPAVRRPLWQTLKIIREITSILGKAPAKIFIEMAKGPEEKGKKTVSRKDRLTALYKNCKKEAAAFHVDLEKLSEDLEKRDESALRSDKLYLYYTQMGRSAYTGNPIDVRDLFDVNRYDIDHIYPQSVTGDDSLNNRVLVEKQVNAQKKDRYPLGAALNGYKNPALGIAIQDIQKEMGAFWRLLLEKELITKEKYHRLTRRSGITEDEKAAFIGRQLVETRQSTKACAEILKKAYPETTIVYTKAKNASEFRHYAGFVKVRDLNDYHHAKDAYLNIVVGNVFHTKFTANPVNFLKEKNAVYSLHPESFYKYPVERGGKVAWTPGEDGTMATVRKWMKRNNILFTRKCFIGKGGLFDQNIMKKGKGQVPLQTGMDIGKYGGYNKASAAYFMLVKSTGKKGEDVYSIENVPLYLAEKLKGNAEKEAYCREIWEQKKINQKNPQICVSCIPIQSLLKIEGFSAHLAGKSGKSFRVRNAVQLCLDDERVSVLKRILKFKDRATKEKGLKLTSFDGLTDENLLDLYTVFAEKLTNSVYAKKLSSPGQDLVKGTERFIGLSLEDKCFALSEILHLFQCNAATADLTAIGGAGQAGALGLNATLSTKQAVVLVRQSITGFFEKEIRLAPFAE